MNLLRSFIEKIPRLWRWECSFFARTRCARTLKKLRGVFRFAQVGTKNGLKFFRFREAKFCEANL